MLSAGQGERRELLSLIESELAERGGVLVHGPEGIGKTRVARALADSAQARGETVLSSRPVSTDRELPHAALADLLRTLTDDTLAGLPAVQRSALRAVLRREPPTPQGLDPVALRLALLSLLGALATTRPVLLVVDGAHLVDEASAEALAFAAERLDPAHVRTLVTETTAPGTAPACGPSLATRAAREVLLLPLSFPELCALVEPDGLPHWLLRKVHDTSGGNPLFALELIRAVSSLPRLPAREDPLPLTERLRTLVADRIDPLEPAERQVLLLAATAGRPTPELLLRAAGGTGMEAAEVERAVAAALRAGTLEADGAVLRFTNPLYAVALQTHSGTARCAAHACLARTVPDPSERLAHLALATTDPDDALATALAAGAQQAGRRGDPATAAELGRLAHARTPPHDSGLLVERALDAARLAYDTTDYELTRELARQTLGGSASPAQRVRACVLIIHASNQALNEAAEVFDEMLASVGEDLGLHAQLHYARGLRAHITDGETSLARVEAARAAALAHRAGDRTTELMALALQAFAASLLGRADAQLPLLRALATPQDSGQPGGHNGPRAIKARLDLFADRHREAAGELDGLLRRARGSGATEDVIFLLCASIDVDLRAGRTAEAMASAAEVSRLSRDIGVRLAPVPHSVALAEAAGGDLSRAAGLAREGVRVAESRHDQVYLPLALCVLGHVQLRSGAPSDAVESLEQARGIALRRGITEPAAVPWAVDLVEALVAMGDHARAARLADEALATAERLGRDGVCASLLRADALRRAAGPDRADARTAVAALRLAADRHHAQGLRLEHGRDLLALGTVEWRHRHTTAAGAAWRQAAEVFQECAAHPWLDQANAALTRVDGAGEAKDGCHPAGPARLLSATEYRMAGMVAAGSTNREIAAGMFLAVKTVESRLTRIYRKLGVRSRTELGVLLRNGSRRPGRGADLAERRLGVGRE